MNRTAMDRAVQKAVQRRFRGRMTMLPRAALHYPQNLEREYTKVTEAYMAILQMTLAEHLPAIRRAMTEAREGMRFDAFDEFGELLYGVNDVIMNTFTRVRRDFERRALAFNLEGKIALLAGQCRRFTVSQWRRFVQNSLGVNILEDYYMGEFFRQALTQWTNRNVGLIKSVPRETLTELRNIVQDGWRRGLLNDDISGRIKKAYDKYKHKAKFWARDQMAKLNADLTRQQQKDAGVDEYVWSTSLDERVRGNPDGKWPDGGDHYTLEGRRHNWTNPPVVDTRTGRRAHPGEDYNCRCVALPVFNLPGLSLPWEGAADGQS